MIDDDLDFTLPFRREMPKWVQRWHHARDAKDDRLFPEQGEGFLSLHYYGGYPVGHAKDVSYPSGYEREVRVIEQKPKFDAEFWVQPEEYGS